MRAEREIKPRHDCGCGGDAHKVTTQPKCGTILIPLPLPTATEMPLMPGKYPPKQQQTEVVFEHNAIEVTVPLLAPLTWTQPPTEDDLVVLEPAARSTRLGQSGPLSAKTDTPVDPYNLDNYLLTSAEGFSPFEQNLGKAPFKDLRGDDIWPALAYTEDGGVHPGKVSKLKSQSS
jgi:hypothetical protein